MRNDIFSTSLLKKTASHPSWQPPFPLFLPPLPIRRFPGKRPKYKKNSLVFSICNDIVTPG